MNRYCRADILRILHITPKQLSGWQRAGLAPVSDEFSFFDLLQLKKVRDLRAKRVRPAVIRESLAAMRKQVAGMENPLLEASAFSVGNRVAFRHDGRSVEPVAGQFVMEFEPVGAVVSAKVRPIARFDSVADLFARGVALEEHPSTHDEAIEVYLRVLQLEPDHAAAHINLGTLYYNRQDFVAAERHYRHAVKSDPRYALAYFDLGNVLDETETRAGGHRRLSHGNPVGPDLRRCTLQSGARLRAATPAPPGLAALEELTSGLIAPDPGRCMRASRSHESSKATSSRWSSAGSRKSIHCNPNHHALTQAHTHAIHLGGNGSNVRKRRS